MKRRPLVVFADSLSTRMFLAGGVVARLAEQTGGDVDLLAAFDLHEAGEKFNFDHGRWLAGSRVPRIIEESELPGRPARLPQRIDRLLDDAFGYYSLNMRLSLKHGFMRSRMRPRHRNPYLDLTRGLPFPRSERLYRLLFSWYYGPHRPIAPAVSSFLKERTSLLVTSNLQFRNTQPYVRAAHRLGIPVVGHIGSWDHPVGKGVIFPGCAVYVVQSAFMADALTRYHGIAPGKIVTTGWPQMDHYARRRPAEEYRQLLVTYGLEPGHPCVLFAGNTPNNAPYEPAFLERVADHWRSSGLENRCSLVFRPHPKDPAWRVRFARILGRPGIHVQAANYNDIDVVALLLQHVGCVVTNAGTFLLDSLANDRPVVCVLYDEGAPAGSEHAAKNVTGHHYRELMASGAFYPARRFEEVIDGIERCLALPGDLADKRRDIRDRLIGRLDGGAGQRVSDVIARFLPGGESSGSR